jgi:hypothetical protein
MPKTFPTLEQDRSAVLRQIPRIGDLRSGSIVEVMACWSKPRCHCARPSDLGHGPNFRLTRKVRCKTVAETLSTPAALRKAKREVAEFRKFQAVTRRLLQVNTEICQRCPVEEEALSAQEKNGGCNPS